MNKKQFEMSVKLFKDISELKLSSGQSLRDELCLGQEISFLDVLAPYLVLYRFPRLFSSDGRKHSLKDWLSYYFRPIRGVVAGFRDFVVSYFYRNTKACQQWLKNKQKVLFLGFIPTFYRDVLRPVADLLVGAEIEVAVLEHYQKLQKKVNVKDKVKFQSFWGHWGNDSGNLTQNILKRLRVLEKEILDKDELTKIVPGSFNSFNKFALRREFYWIFRREIKRLIPLFVSAKHILEQHRPSLVITADDADQRHRVYSLLAQKKGVPVLLIQQGLSSKDYPEWLFFSPTVVAAMGQSSAEDMIAQGVPVDKIIVTGNPGFDRLSNFDPDACVFLRKSLGVLDDEKMILFASQPYYVGSFSNSEIRREMIRAIAQAAVSLKNVKLIVKPHQGDNIWELKGLLQKFPQIVIVNRKIDILPLIKSCDILITFYSTTALQALYAGKPVINVDFAGSGGLQLYSESGATWVASSVSEIVTHIQSLTNKNRTDEIISKEHLRNEFLLRYSYRADGNAAKRVLGIALNMLKS